MEPAFEYADPKPEACTVPVNNTSTLYGAIELEMLLVVVVRNVACDSCQYSQIGRGMLRQMELDILLAYIRKLLAMKDCLYVAFSFLHEKVGWLKNVQIHPFSNLPSSLYLLHIQRFPRRVIGTIINL